MEKLHLSQFIKYSLLENYSIQDILEYFMSNFKLHEIDLIIASEEEPRSKIEIPDNSLFVLEVPKCTTCALSEELDRSDLHIIEHKKLNVYDYLSYFTSIYTDYCIKKNCKLYVNLPKYENVYFPIDTKDRRSCIAFSMLIAHIFTLMPPFFKNSEDPLKWDIQFSFLPETTDPTSAGIYNSREKVIIILLNTVVYNGKNLLGTILHEISHWISNNQATDSVEKNSEDFTYMNKKETDIFYNANTKNAALYGTDQDWNSRDEEHSAELNSYLYQHRNDNFNLCISSIITAFNTFANLNHNSVPRNNIEYIWQEFLYEYISNKKLIPILTRDLINNFKKTEYGKYLQINNTGNILIPVVKDFITSNIREIIKQAAKLILDSQ